MQEDLRQLSVMFDPFTSLPEFLDDGTLDTRLRWQATKPGMLQEWIDLNKTSGNRDLRKGKYQLRVHISQGYYDLYTGHNQANSLMVDEVIKYYRPNSLFRNFEVKGGADRTLIYLTLSMQQFLKECERYKTRGDAEKALHALVIKQFPIPGGPGWSLGGMFPTPNDIQEGESWRLYFKQAREECAQRLIKMAFTPGGDPRRSESVV